MGMELGQRIRELRLKKKLTQNDVVGEYMTRNMLSKIENGSAAPSVKTLEFLASVLDVPTGYFLDKENVVAADTEQFQLIEEIAGEFAKEAGSKDRALLGWPLCIQARARLAAGDADGALALFGRFESGQWPENILPHIYMLLEDCYREKGDYKMAYEYALKRLDE